MFFEAFRFCWLQTPADWGGHGRFTNDHRLTIGRRTQAERSECEDERGAIPVEPRSPTEGKWGRPPFVDNKSLLDVYAVISSGCPED